MKLVLASKEEFFLPKGYDLLGIPKSQMKIGAITSHLKPVVDKDYLQYVENYRNEMAQSGIDFHEFDLENKTKEEIYDFFKDKNVVQIAGGNVFYLIKVIRESGFDKILKELLEKGLCYIGCSSGSYIMCPTLEVGTWRGKENFGITDLTGLGYVPFVIKAHYKDEQADYIKEKMKDLKYPLRILRDMQGIIVEDGQYTFTGEGKEVILK